MGLVSHEHYDRIMDESIPYESVGRTKQKRRTREALTDAARALIARGATPTVEEAAAAASISRTTAYRYFRSQRELLVAAHPVIEISSLLGDDPPQDPAERIERAVDELIRLTIEHEPELRTMLRLSLETDAQRERLVLRRGRAIGWLRDALEPLRGRLPEHELERLVCAVRAAVGIEALVWLRDVAGLSHKEAVDIMKWSARALFRAALGERHSGGEACEDEEQVQHPRVKR